MYYIMIPYERYYQKKGKKMRIQLSDHFTYRKLLRFALPSIVMMIFVSIYGVVDGLFISNVLGSDALASINIVMPLIMMVGAVGFMLGTGGSAEVAKTLGEGKRKRANRYFTMMIFTIIILGILISAVCIVLSDRFHIYSVQATYLLMIALHTE